MRETLARTTLIVVPAYNEAPRLEAVLADIAKAVPQAHLLVVDDGSRDGTADVARQCGARVVSHPVNLGYGAALQTGYRYAVRGGYLYVVQLDADGQHDPADIPSLLAPLQRGLADIAIGSRFVEASDYRMSGIRTLGRVLLMRLLQICGGPRVADPTSGYQALVRPAFVLCCEEFFPSDFPDVDVLLTLHRAGLRIVEVPVTMAQSPPGRIPMHAGLHALYYPYKMLLAIFRSTASHHRA